MKQNKELTENEKLQCQLLSEKAVNALCRASCHIFAYIAKAEVVENSKLKARVNELEAQLKSVTKPNVNLYIDVDKLNSFIRYLHCEYGDCESCPFDSHDKYSDCFYQRDIEKFLLDLQNQLKLKGGADND